MKKNIDWDAYRQKGDAQADEWVRQILAKNDKTILREILPFLSDYSIVSSFKIPEILKDILATRSLVLSLAQKKQIIRATEFYQKNELNIDLVLGLYALPYCYLGADGARVLQLSARIQTDTYKRLKETGAFVKAVMLYDNWQSGFVFEVINKVRLLHAIIRYFTLQYPQWDTAKWGVPINQQDMLGTNVAFSYIVLKGLKQLNVSIAPEYESAYLETWQIIGQLMGIEAELLPVTFEQNVMIDKAIATHQFKESEQGKQLAQALLQVVRGQAGSDVVADLLQNQMFTFLGAKNAKMLGITETKSAKNLFQLYQFSTQISQIFK